MVVVSPDHDAGAMIDKEILVDRSARMDIDACQPVSMLCHNSRNQRNTHGKQFMGNPVNGDSVDSRIGVNNLFHAVSGGIAVISRLNVRLEIFSDLSDPAEKFVALTADFQFDGFPRSRSWTARSRDTLSSSACSDDT